MTFYYQSPNEVVLTQVQPPEGGVPPGPDQGLPQPPLVIWGPGDPRPTLPIAGWDPGSGAWPKPPEPGTPPPDGIWGPNDPRPTVPIAEPPWGWGNKPPVPEVDPIKGWKIMYGWTPTTGWFVFALPTGPVPTPSSKKK